MNFSPILPAYSIMWKANEKCFRIELPYEKILVLLITVSGCKTNEMNSSESFIILDEVTRSIYMNSGSVCITPDSVS